MLFIFFIIYFVFVLFCFSNQSTFSPTDLLLFDSLKRINKPILFSWFFAANISLFCLLFIKRLREANYITLNNSSE